MTDKDKIKILLNALERALNLNNIGNDCLSEIDGPDAREEYNRLWTIYYKAIKWGENE